jgi:hypothetical protein
MSAFRTKVRENKAGVNAENARAKRMDRLTAARDQDRDAVLEQRRRRRYNAIDPKILAENGQQ